MIADKLDKKLPYKDTKNNAYAVNEMIECISRRIIEIVN